MHESHCIAPPVLKVCQTDEAEQPTRLSTSTRSGRGQLHAPIVSTSPTLRHNRNTHPTRECTNTNHSTASGSKSGSSPSSLAPATTCSHAHSQLRISTLRHHHTTRQSLMSAETKRSRLRSTSMAAKSRFRLHQRLRYAACAAKIDRGSSGSTQYASTRPMSSSEVIRSGSCTKSTHILVTTHLSWARRRQHAQGHQIHGKHAPRNIRRDSRLR